MSCVAKIIGVTESYAAAPLGAWVVSVEFHNRSSATFVHTGFEAPEIGSTWLMDEPQLLVPWVEPQGEVSDGWSTWSVVCERCGQNGVHVVRPGKTQCSFCD